MQVIEWLGSHRFPTDERPLATLSVRVDEIASRFGVSVHVWDDEGLGPARGLACHISSGHVFVLVEHELSIQHGYTRGPGVLVDAFDLGATGADVLVAELMEALGLSKVDITGVIGPDDVQSASRCSEEFRSRSTED